MPRAARLQLLAAERTVTIHAMLVDKDNHIRAAHAHICAPPYRLLGGGTECEDSTGYDLVSERIRYTARSTPGCSVR